MTRKKKAGPTKAKEPKLVQKIVELTFYNGIEVRVPLAMYDNASPAMVAYWAAVKLRRTAEDYAGSARAAVAGEQADAV